MRKFHHVLMQIEQFPSAKNISWATHKNRLKFAFA